MACVLVDVDGTLLDGPSTELRFILYLLARGRIGWAQMRAAAIFPVRWCSRFGKHVFKKNKAYLTGLHTKDVARDAETFVAETVRPRLRGEILELIAAHAARGDDITLLTGTPDFIARPLAGLLGAQTVCATECARQDGVYTAEPPLLHPFGETKVVLARKICREAGSPLADAIAYADSIHDLPLMLQVGRAVAAWPDAALRAIAEKGNWLILPQKSGARQTAANQETTRG
jgi:HAD superfamily phosphoserine phosphatase-like hydrolase